VRRTSDQNTGYQAAEVYVDGTDTGEWLEPLANPAHRWLDDIYQLPASLTTGHNSLSIRLVPVSGAPAWTGAAYTALTREVP
jgi:hypothetical protein